MQHYHTTLAASRLGIHHVTMMDQAEAAADAVDHVIARAWKQTLAVLSRDAGPRQNYVRALLAIGQMQDAVPRTLAQQFRRVYVRGRQGAGAALASALPMKILRQVSPLPAEVIKSELREDLFPGGMIEVSPEGVTSRQPARRKRSAKKERAIYEDLIFPGPTEDEVLGVLSPFIRPNDWQGIGQTRRKMPQELADEIAKGIASGLTQAQLAKQLLPFYEGHKARARTVARTFSMAIAQRANQDANDKLGDLCIGFQIHATRDSHTRPHHAARDGTIYYKDPKGNQLGLDQMPRPPFEADGSLAFNCRCYLSPVLRPLEAFAEDPAKLARFETAMEKVIPDPIDYSRWFDQATEKQKVQAVGPVRYRTLKARLPAEREPQYADFLDQEGGNLVPVDQLKAETPQQQQARRAEVDQLIAKRQRQIKQVARLGFETPPPPVQRPMPEPMPPPQIEVAPLAAEMQSPALAQALRLLASQPEFLSAWQVDVERIRRQANPVPLEYLIPGGAGALRVMAELLAQELVPSGDPARMQLAKWFRKAAAVLRGMI